MFWGIKARAPSRASFSAVLFGAGVGLALGAIYMQAGLADHAAERARAADMAEAAAYGYTGSWLDARGAGLRTGLDRYGFGGSGGIPVARGSAKARRRADLECLTDAVYYEARGESARGQAAVAQVVLNRVKHPNYPKSVCAVVFQGAGRRGCQFSFACDGSMRRGREAEAWDRARAIAARALAGAVVGYVGKATHYHTLSVSPFWAPQMLRVATVGTHVFYRIIPGRNVPAATAVPVLENALLTSGPAPEGQDLSVAPAIEKAIEASLQPAVAEPGKATPATAGAKPAEAARLEAPQPVIAAAS